MFSGRASLKESFHKMQPIGSGVSDGQGNAYGEDESIQGSFKSASHGKCDTQLYTLLKKSFICVEEKLGLCKDPSCELPVTRALSRREVQPPVCAGWRQAPASAASVLGR